MSSIITVNRRARFNYAIEREWEAGVCFEGWEVKSLRAGHVQLNEGYVTIKNQEVWLLGCHISPLSTASTHIHPQSLRTRKLLLTGREIKKLGFLVQTSGYTLVPLKLFWKKNWIKLQIGLAKGKKLYDKRAALKERDWSRQKARLTQTNF